MEQPPQIIVHGPSDGPEDGANAGRRKFKRKLPALREKERKLGESSEDMCSCTTGSTAHGAFQDRRGGQDLRSFGLASVRSPAGRQRCALSW